MLCVLHINLKNWGTQKFSNWELAASNNAITCHHALKLKGFQFHVDNADSLNAGETFTLLYLNQA